jgi:hypothetical protein
MLALKILVPGPSMARPSPGALRKSCFMSQSVRRPESVGRAKKGKTWMMASGPPVSPK